MIALAFSPIFLPMGLAPVVLGLAAVAWVLFWAFPEVRRGRYPLACFVTGALLGDNANLRELRVGQTLPQVLDTAGTPLRVDPARSGQDECLSYRWIGPVALASGCERWVFLRDGRVTKVYDAQSP